LRFWLFAAAIGLSSFALTSIASSAAIAGISARAARRLARYSAKSRAAWLFRLRVLPAALAIVISLGVAVPVYLAYEPAESAESLSLTLIAFAVTGAALLALGTWRAAAAWRATEAVRRDWLRRGRRVEGFDTAIPLFAIDEVFPTVAVVGVRHPALFIAEQVLRECTRDEVAAMLRHEAAHVTVGDNLKRFVLRASPDLLRAAGTLERAWACAAEEAADAAAAAAAPGSAIDVAQALIRIARLAPSSRTPELASAFYPGGSIESRVHQLLRSTPAPEAPVPFGCVMLLGTALGLVALVVTAAPLLHQLMEAVVRIAP